MMNQMNNPMMNNQMNFDIKQNFDLYEDVILDEIINVLKIHLILLTKRKKN
jgi:hypothetical protein